MILLILKIVFINVSLCWCAKISTEQGMIFQNFGGWCDEQIEKGNMIWEAICRCQFCVAGLWSIPSIGIAYLLGLITNWKVLFGVPVIIGATSLIHGMVWTVLYYLDSKTNSN